MGPEKVKRVADGLENAPESMEKPEVYQFQRATAHLILNSRCLSHPKANRKYLSLAAPFQLNEEFVIDYDQEMDNALGAGGGNPVIYLSIYGFEEKPDTENQFLEVWQIQVDAIEEAHDSESHGMVRKAAMMRSLATLLRQLPAFELYRQKKFNDRVKGKTTFRVSTTDPGWGVGAGRQSNIKTKNIGEVEVRSGESKGRFSLGVRYRTDIPQDFFAIREAKSLDSNIIRNHFEKPERGQEGKSATQTPIAITRLPTCGGSNNTPPYNPFSPPGTDQPTARPDPGAAALLDSIDDANECRKAAWEPNWWKLNEHSLGLVGDEASSFNNPQSCSLGSAGSIGSDGAAAGEAFQDLLAGFDIGLEIDWPPAPAAPEGSPEKAGELEV